MPPIAPSEALLDACRAGDRDAFAELFTLCRDHVFSVALHVCGSHAAAADVSQEVFVKLLTRLPQFDRRAAFSTWLYRIVVNAAVDYRRSIRRIVPLPDSMLDAHAVEEDVAQEERRRHLHQALGRLPAKLRIPLVLRHLEGLAYAEIAQVLGLSLGTVSSRLSRAHQRLARELAVLAPDVAGPTELVGRKGDL